MIYPLLEQVATLILNLLVASSTVSSVFFLVLKYYVRFMKTRLKRPRQWNSPVWTNQEGSRFQPAMQGSGTYVGRFDLETELNKTDVNGIRLGDELERIGYLGEITELGSRHMGRIFLKRTSNKGRFLKTKKKPSASSD